LIRNAIILKLLLKFTCENCFDLNIAPLSNDSLLLVKQLLILTVKLKYPRLLV